ncbi:MAG: HNH endonuclease [archaeon]
MATEYPPDWNTRRKKVYQRDNYTCQHCGVKGGPIGNAELHAHHIVPKSKGGTHQLSNLHTLCAKCHQAAHENGMAPLRSNLHNQHQAYELLSEFTTEVKEFMHHLNEGITVEEPGTLSNYELENKRISTIQKIAKFTHLYKAPDEKHKGPIETMVKSMIELLKFPEDGWDMIDEDEHSKTEKKEILRSMTEKRQRKVGNAVSHVHGMGVGSFFPRWSFLGTAANQGHAL